MIYRTFLTLCVLGGLTLFASAQAAPDSEANETPASAEVVRSVCQPRRPMQPGYAGRRSHHWRDENLRRHNA